MTISPRLFLVALPSALVLTALNSCTIQGAETKVSIGTVHNTLDVQAESYSLKIINQIGSVRLAKAPGTTLTVTAEVYLAESRALEWTGKPTFADHIVLRNDGGSIVIEDAHRRADDHNDWKINLVIGVPAIADLSITLGAGSVDVDLPKLITARIHTGAGSINVHSASIQKQIAADVGAGNVTVKIDELAPSDKIILDVGVGTASLSLPMTVSATFDLRVGVGGIEADDRLGVNVKRTLVAATGSGTCGEGKTSVVINVGTGDIDLR